MTDVRELLDREEIRVVLMRYLQGIDRRRPELVRACFHADAHLDYPPVYAGGVDGFLVGNITLSD